jgi:hypothetical protein
MMPWSLLLAALLWPSFRRAIGDAQSQVVFLTCVIAVTFPTCWLVAGARGRYYLPLYPCFAPLVGLVVERCVQAGSDMPWRRLWPWFLQAMAVVMLAGGAVVLAATWIDTGPLPLRQPGWFAAIYTIAAAGLAAIAFRSAGRGPAGATSGVWAVAVFLGLSYTGVVTNVLIALSEPSPEAAIAQLKERLPPDVHLVSLGYIDPLFAYYYREPIRYTPWPRPGAPIDPDIQYFCCGNDSISATELKIPYQRVAAISCDRYRSAQPKRLVVVGRR